MEFLYVVSTPEKAENNEYKIGKHTGLQNKLLNRYKTSLINPIIYFFYPVIDSLGLEKKIKNLLDRFCIRDMNNKRSEWFKLNLETIIQTIFMADRNENVEIIQRTSGKEGKDEVIKEYLRSSDSKNFEDLICVNAAKIPYNKIDISDIENDDITYRDLILDIKMEKGTEITIAKINKYHFNKWFINPEENLAKIESLFDEIFIEGNDYLEKNIKNISNEKLFTSQPDKLATSETHIPKVFDKYHFINTLNRHFGLKNSWDSEIDIPRKKIEDLPDEIFTDLIKNFDSKSIKKDSYDFKERVSILKKVYKSWSNSDFEVGKEVQVKINGKRVRQSPYKIRCNLPVEIIKESLSF